MPLGVPGFFAPAERRLLVYSAKICFTHTMRKHLVVVLSWLAWTAVASAELKDAQITVYVALCDNATQGIQPVGAKIGNGNDAASNLYWGCSDGMKLYFKNSAKWKLEKTEKNPDEVILEQLTFRHTTFPEVTLTAFAYRGSEMKRCLGDFYEALTSPDDPADLVAFIGHNGLMDFRIPDRQPNADTPPRDAVILCCLSRAYFQPRLEAVGVRPVLLTEQLMYPGAFLLHDGLEGWLREETRAQIRIRAAKAYSRNQGISLKAASGIFSTFED